MLHVLIVDDDEDDRDLFCIAVRDVDANIDCLTAKNGHEALVSLRSQRLKTPDVIFLDLNMPRLNGIQTLVELKKDDVLKDIPVVMYSTSNLEEDKKKTERLGAIAFVTKPTALSELHAVIVDVLHEHLHMLFK